MEEEDWRRERNGEECGKWRRGGKKRERRERVLLTVTARYVQAHHTLRNYFSPKGITRARKNHPPLTVLYCREREPIPLQTDPFLAFAVVFGSWLWRLFVALKLSRI